MYSRVQKLVADRFLFLSRLFKNRLFRASISLNIRTVIDNGLSYYLKPEYISLVIIYYDLVGNYNT